MLILRIAAITIAFASLILLAAVAYNHVVTVEALRQFGATGGLYIAIVPYFLPTICLAVIAFWLLWKQWTIASVSCGIVAFAWAAVLWISQASSAVG